MQSKLQICKDWFSHADKRETMNTAIDIDLINSKISKWATKYDYIKCSLGLVTNEDIIQAAKSLGIKVGKRKRTITEYNWRKLRRNVPIGYEYVTCFNISSMSVPFRPHLHTEEKQIDYYHYYNQDINHIHLLHNFVRNSNNSFSGLRFIWIMKDQETGNEFNCFTDNGYLKVMDRQVMWGIRNHNMSESSMQYIRTTNPGYLKLLDKLVKGCPEFMMECEEKTLMRL